MEETILVQVDKLRACVQSVLQHNGMPEDQAALVADCMVDADLRNISSHGVTRLGMYLAAMDEGGIQRQFQFDVVSDAPAVAVLDVKGSHGIVAAHIAMKMAMQKAQQFGIGMVNVRHSNHCGELGYFTRLAASAGMIGIAASNAPENMAPWGSAEKFLGTNPLAIAIPTKNDPFSLDMATSTVARGKIILASKKGKQIPLGWAIDSEGKPTTDAGAALLGSVLPFGGPKGSGIAMAIDVICGLLSGSGFGHYMYDATKYPERPNETGHSCIAIDISKFMDYQTFLDNMNVYIQDLQALNPAPGFQEVLMPGLIEARGRVQRLQEGIQLPNAVYQELSAFAQQSGTSFNIRF